MLTVRGKRTVHAQTAASSPDQSSHTFLSRDEVPAESFLLLVAPAQPDAQDLIHHPHHRLLRIPSRYTALPATRAIQEERRKRADPTLSGVKARRYVAHSLTQGTTTLSFPEVIHSSCPIHRLQVLQDPRHRPSATRHYPRARRRRNRRALSRPSLRPLPHRCPTGPRPLPRTRFLRAMRLARTQPRHPANMARHPRATRPGPR